MENEFFGTLSALARFLFLPALLVGASIFFYRARTIQTLLLLLSVAIACLGRLIQLFAPFEPTYIKDSSGVVTGATGAFPPMWYLGEVVASLGFVGLAVFFVLFSLSYSASKKNEK